ncbi:MAG: hypothetical protein GY820_39660 [Gammaproteobacteria bacterium]|nr:hypothetical protein [Gammaproteobacteria bacterium]
MDRPTRLGPTECRRPAPVAGLPTPCDFFQRGYLKSLVYREKPRDLEDLKQKITDSCAFIEQEIIDRSLVEFRNRLEKCVEIGGGHIEHLP